MENSVIIHYDSLELYSSYALSTFAGTDDCKASHDKLIAEAMDCFRIQGNTSLFRLDMNPEQRVLAPSSLTTIGPNTHLYLVRQDEIYSTPAQTKIYDDLKRRVQHIEAHLGLLQEKKGMKRPVTKDTSDHISKRHKASSTLNESLVEQTRTLVEIEDACAIPGPSSELVDLTDLQSDDDQVDVETPSKPFSRKQLARRSKQKGLQSPVIKSPAGANEFTYSTEDLAAYWMGGGQTKNFLDIKWRQKWQLEHDLELHNTIRDLKEAALKAEHRKKHFPNLKYGQIVVMLDGGLILQDFQILGNFALDDSKKQDAHQTIFIDYLRLPKGKAFGKTFYVSVPSDLGLACRGPQAIVGASKMESILYIFDRLVEAEHTANPRHSRININEYYLELDGMPMFNHKTLGDYGFPFETRSVRLQRKQSLTVHVKYPLIDEQKTFNDVPLETRVGDLKKQRQAVMNNGWAGKMAIRGKPGKESRHNPTWEDSQNLFSLVRNHGIVHVAYDS